MQMQYATPDTMLKGGARPGPYTKGGPNGEGDDVARQVYVGNLPYRLTWQVLKDHFKQVGNVENARILTEDGTDWGRSRGVGIVRFKTPEEAQMAIERLNGSDLEGRSILVDPWTGSSGKWKSEKGQGKGGGSWDYKGGKGGAKGMGKGGVARAEVFGENLVYVGNLPYEVRWQDLKDAMSQAGTVEFCNILTMDGTEFGRSKGAGCVRFSNATEVEQAIAMLNETDLGGRKIQVDHWTSKKNKV